MREKQDAQGFPWAFFILKNLNQASFFECYVCTVFIYRLYRRGGECERNVFVEFWHEDTLFLQIRLFAEHPAGVELGSTNTVGVAATDN